jgi:hypothetical protein
LADTYNAEHSSLYFPDATKAEGGYPVIDGPVHSANGLLTKSATEVDILGKGLQNEVGEYNCFLNVIIQVATTIPFLLFHGGNSSICDAVV